MAKKIQCQDTVHLTLFFLGKDHPHLSVVIPLYCQMDDTLQKELWPQRVQQ